MKPTLILILCLLLSFLNKKVNSQTINQVPEISVPGLGDIAMASFDNYGRPVIYYDPMVVSSVPSNVAKFFKYHEYGHVNLGHLNTFKVLIMSDPQTQSWVSQKLEKDADCFAAKKLSKSEINSVLQFFYDNGDYQKDYLHPSNFERAENIKNCLKTGSKEIEPEPELNDQYLESFATTLKSLLSAANNNFSSIKGEYKSTDYGEYYLSDLKFEGRDDADENGKIWIRKNNKKEFHQYILFQCKDESLANETYTEICDNCRQLLKNYIEKKINVNEGDCTRFKNPTNYVQIRFESMDYDGIEYNVGITIGKYSQQ